MLRKPTSFFLITLILGLSGCGTAVDKNLGYKVLSYFGYSIAIMLPLFLVAVVLYFYAKRDNNVKKR